MFLSIIATGYTLSLLLFLVHGNTCSGDSNCEDIVTMPLLDGLRATLKADLDVKNMNDHLKTYIASEIKKGFANAMNDVMKQIVNTGLEEINATIISAIQESLAEKGVTYIRWGRKGCPAGADIIYTGQVGGNSHANRGGGVNYLCLPNDPENGQHQPYGNAQVYGREYELGPSYKPSGWSESMNNKEVPCAVCLKKQRSNILVIPVQGNTCSGDSKCDDVVTMPLLDGLKATLKADLDVKNMNDHLKTYIASEIKKGFENAMHDVMKQIVNKGIEEINDTITTVIQESLAGKGVTYIRWGRKDCPAGADIVYTGQVGGNDHINKGGGVNYLCLPNDPENGQHQSYSNDQVYGGEYELSSSSKPLGWSESMHDKEVPCAVCYKQRGSAVLIVPGRKTCYEGWNSEYHGYLMSDHYTHNKKEYACLDINAEPLDNNNGNGNGALFYPLRTKCGSLRCPPYTNEADVLCVVCTK